MEDIFCGTIFVIVGVCMVIFRLSLSAWSARGQNYSWGFNFGRRAIRHGAVVFLILGAVLIMFGLLLLLGLADFES